MKGTLSSFIRLVLLAGLLSANAAFAVDDAVVAELNSKASSANEKADGNQGRIGALEATHDSDIAEVYSAISAIELTPGPAGEDGADGADGAPGVDGQDGAVGPAGPAGADGVDGAPGADGVDGAPGADGVDGAPGADGADGAPGADGAVGATGPAGADGADGATGPAGADGADGADGAPGADGAVGATGPAGADGGGVPASATVGDLVYWNGTSWIATSPAQAVAGLNKHQPSLGMNYIIALQGAFPSRNGIEPLIGEVIMFAGTFAPRGWAFCEGQLLAINDNTALFSLLGTTYGGDGRTTFGLPDLRGRVPVGVEGFGTGNVSLGDEFGSEAH